MNIVEQWKQEDNDFIRKKVIEHNMKELPDELKTAHETISFILKDDKGYINGGITANMFWHHMHIESLWVDENLRGEGYGRVLLEKIEHLAIEKGCRFIYLDTFSFQAPEFYKQNGYEVSVILRITQGDLTNIFYIKGSINSFWKNEILSLVSRIQLFRKRGRLCNKGDRFFTSRAV